MKARYKKARTRVKETNSPREALDRVFTNPSKIKDNVLKITDLRDMAVHLFIPEVQGIASRICRLNAGMVYSVRLHRR